MQLSDIHVISEIQHWLDNEDNFWLCTVVSTYGSAPRPIGSLFAWNGTRRLGSISGGCLEDTFIAQLDIPLEKNDSPKAPYLFHYGKHLVDENVTIELPCGGSINLLIEHYGANKLKRQHLRQCCQYALQHKPFSRQINLETGHLALNIVLDPSCLQAVEKTAKQVTLVYSQAWRLLIFGISQVTEWVARFGLMAGYEVKICDMREELADSWHFTKEQGGVDITWSSPDAFVDKYSDEKTLILALSHDLRIDDLGLLAAMESKAFYIGAMGSMRTTKNRLERLERIGEFSAHQLARLHAPIGLPIGSKTPMEIAIAIFADIIAKQNGIRLVRGS